MHLNTPSLAPLFQRHALTEDCWTQFCHRLFLFLRKILLNETPFDRHVYCFHYFFIKNRAAVINHVHM